MIIFTFELLKFCALFLKLGQVVIWLKYFQILIFTSRGEVISQFTYLAKQQGISKTTVSAIAKTLEQRKQENAALFL